MLIKKIHRKHCLRPSLIRYCTQITSSKSCTGLCTTLPKMARSDTWWDGMSSSWNRALCIPHLCCCNFSYPSAGHNNEAHPHEGSHKNAPSSLERNSPALPWQDRRSVDTITHEPDGVKDSSIRGASRMTQSIMVQSIWLTAQWDRETIPS